MNNLDRDSVSPWVKEQACLLSAIIKILSLSGAKGRHAYYPFKNIDLLYANGFSLEMQTTTHVGYIWALLCLLYRTWEQKELSEIS